MLDTLLNEFKKELKDTIIDIIKLQLKEFQKHFHPKEHNVYLTRKEASEMLKIDLSTLFLWSKKGLLPSFGIGKRVYYKISDIENAMVKLNN